MAVARINVPTSAAMYDAALEGLTREDELIIAAGGVPPLYDSGARYKKERSERWRHAVDVATDGWGDCEDLAAYRAAELRVSGEDPSAAIKTYKTGPRRYHAIVSRLNGSLWEDPSKLLGMHVNPKREALYLNGGHFMHPVSDIDGEEEDIGACVVGEDPTPEDVTNITFGVMRLPNRQGFTGWLRIPIGAGQAILARSPAFGPAQAATPEEAKQLAAQAALQAAGQALNNPALANIKVPPSTLTAIKMSNLGEKGARLIADNPEALAAMGPYGKIAATALQVPGVKELFIGGGKMGDKLTKGTVGKIPGLKRLF